MSEPSKATPGPWTVGDEITDEYYEGDEDECEGRAQYSREITWNGGVPIAYVAQDDRREANARLIAESPAMRDLLLEWQEVGQTIENHGTVLPTQELTERTDKLLERIK